MSALEKACGHDRLEYWGELQEEKSGEDLLGALTFFLCMNQEKPKQRLTNLIPYIPFETIVYATNNLSEDNMISSLSLTGRLFSGIHPDGTLIAIREIEFTGNFEALTTLLATLRHPNIALLLGFSVGVGDAMETKRFLVFEFLQGGSLKDRQEQFDYLAKLDILLVVATALNYAAARDVHHGGVSETNVLFDQSGNVKLTDFHMAAFSKTSIDVTTSPSLQGDLRDFGRLLDRCVTDDWPPPQRLVAAGLVEKLAKGHVHHFGQVVAELRCVASATEAAQPLVIKTCDEAIQTEPLLPIREETDTVAGCCLVA